MVEVRSISFCMPILKANTYNLKKSTHFYLLYEESYSRVKLTYFSRTSAFTLDAHCTSTSHNLELFSFEIKTCNIVISWSVTVWLKVVTVWLKDSYAARRSLIKR